MLEVSTAREHGFLWLFFFFLFFVLTAVMLRLIMSFFQCRMLTCPQQSETALRLSAGRTEHCFQTGPLLQQGWEFLGHCTDGHKLQAVFLRWLWTLLIPDTCICEDSWKKVDSEKLFFWHSCGSSGFLFLSSVLILGPAQSSSIFTCCCTRFWFPGLLSPLFLHRKNRLPLSCPDFSMTEKCSTASLLTFFCFCFHQENYLQAFSWS